MSYFGACQYTPFTLICTAQSHPAFPHGFVSFTLRTLACQDSNLTKIDNLVSRQCDFVFANGNCFGTQGGFVVKEVSCEVRYKSTGGKDIAVLKIAASSVEYLR
jgi:hypothetical protein